MVGFSFILLTNGNNNNPTVETKYSIPRWVFSDVRAFYKVPSTCTNVYSLHLNVYDYTILWHETCIKKKKKTALSLRLVAR